MTLDQDVLRARQLELARPGHTDTDVESEDLVGFRAGTAAFAVPLDALHSIRSSTPPAPLPRVPDWLLGIVAVDGVVIPVAAADVLLGYGGGRPEPRELRLAVLAQSGAPMLGCAIDTLDGPLAGAALQPLPAGTPPYVSAIVRGLVADHLVLDVAALAAALRRPGSATRRTPAGPVE